MTASLTRRRTLAITAALTTGLVSLTAQAAAPKKFVLVHGAWHTGAAWRGVSAALAKQGYQTAAITLPGYGPRNGIPSTVTLDDCAKALAEFIRKQPGQVIVVAHSAAGVVVQQAIPQVASKVAEVIFLNAFIVGDGQRLVDSLPPDIQAMYQKIAADNNNVLPVPDPLVRQVLMPGDSKAAQDMVIAQLVPQPYGYYLGKVNAAAFNKAGVRLGFLFAIDDLSLPPGAYRGMMTSLGNFDEYAIPGGHEVIFTDPKAVAAGLIELARRIK